MNKEYVRNRHAKRARNRIVRNAKREAQRAEHLAFKIASSNDTAKRRARENDEADRRQREHEQVLAIGISPEHWNSKARKRTGKSLDALMDDYEAKRTKFVVERNRAEVERMKAEKEAAGGSGTIIDAKNKIIETYGGQI